MNKTRQPTKEEFDALLEWFSPQKERAGEDYERIRRGLIRFFRFRGCSDPDLLADETINRVSIKLPTFDLSTGVKKISIFYGFAFNIYREYLNQVSRRELQLDLDYPIGSEHGDISAAYDTSEQQNPGDCLEKCLAKLSESDRRMLIRYYSKEKSEKILMRKLLADELGIRPNTLHVKVHRLKKALKNCIERCEREKNV